MRAIHWSSTNQARQIALCTTPLTQQGNNHSAMPPQAAQLLHALAAPLYWQAGAAVGLAQGYAYAAAEVCAALGFSDLERQFRAYVPPQEPASESPAAVGSSSQDQPGRPATVTGVLTHEGYMCGVKQQRSTGIKTKPRPITSCVC